MFAGKEEIIRIFTTSEELRKLAIDAEKHNIEQNIGDLVYKYRIEVGRDRNTHNIATVEIVVHSEQGNPPPDLEMI